MHSGQLEKAGSLRRRTLSRGMSEDESLRHIIREAEESTRHLSRSDSRYGSLKRGQRQESQSEDDLLSENVEMELRTLSLQQDALLFQVDCLQDALEGTEEMLAETQRETHQLSLELERERALRRKMEDMLASVMLDMDRLREERRAEQLQWRATGPVWPQEGTSVDREEGPQLEDRATHGATHRATHTLGQNQTPDAHAEENDESSGYEDAPAEFSPGPSTPDEQEEEEEKEEEKEEEEGVDGGPRGRTNEDSCTLS